MRLDKFDNSDFDRGRPVPVEALWRICEGLLFNSFLPGSFWRVWLLRMFGSRIGKNVAIKPYVRVKFPWQLVVGDHSWIGESVWIDNLGEVSIGDHCCLSQGAYLCTGSHRWDKDAFDLVVEKIDIRDHVWIGAFAKVSPGVLIGEGVVLTMNSLANTDLEEWTIYGGWPAKEIKPRIAPWFNSTENEHFC